MIIEKVIALICCLGLIVVGIISSIRTKDIWFGLAQIFVGLANIKFMTGFP